MDFQCTIEDKASGFCANQNLIVGKNSPACSDFQSNKDDCVMLFNSIEEKLEMIERDNQSTQSREKHLEQLFKLVKLYVETVRSQIGV